MFWVRQSTLFPFLWLYDTDKLCVLSYVTPIPDGLESADAAYASTASLDYTLD